MNSNPKSNRFPNWIFLILANLITLSLSDSRTYEAGLFCGNTTVNSGTYIPNFVKEMEILSQEVEDKNWGYNGLINSTNSSNVISVYGLAQCFGDMSHTDCLVCFAASRTRLPHCLPANSGRLYLDGCYLRYDSYNFSNQALDPLRDKVNCTASSGAIAVKAKDMLGFKGNVEGLLGNLTDKAVRNGVFAVGGYKDVFGLAQCWETLSKDECRKCLESASKGIKGCVPSEEGRSLYAGCYMRYSTTKFYNDGSGKNNSGRKAGIIVAICLAVTAFLSLSSFLGYTCYKRLSKLKEERNNLGQVAISFNKSNLSYKYEMLEKATNYFSSANKLGQGGAGSVFKGTLPNGETVAVKRLFFNTRQWVDEFFNEVNLISGIQHKNLVKLLGCSIEGPESLLVYEFVLNKSLDHFLFDKAKGQNLNWKQRLEIIVGTAEGIAYLHGGLEMRIIHRDIKSSNILLDENFSPKVADFGLARQFGSDKSHLSTGIAGTLGYMAPEYLVRGQLTEKADVYSFGVLVLEIVSGRKNNAFVEDSSSLVQTVWQLYKRNKLVDCVDPRLGNNFPEIEIKTVLQVALLCTQASVYLRPSMAEVVQMLTENDCEVPEPNQPPFMSTSSLKPGTSAGPHNTHSFGSNTLTQFEETYSSSAPSCAPSSEDFSKNDEIKLI